MTRVFAVSPKGVVHPQETGGFPLPKMNSTDGIIKRLALFIFNVFKFVFSRLSQFFFSAKKGKKPKETTLDTEIQRTRPKGQAGRRPPSRPGRKN